VRCRHVQLDLSKSPYASVGLIGNGLLRYLAGEVPAASLDVLRFNYLSLMAPTDELIICRGDGLHPHVESTYYLSLNP